MSEDKRMIFAAADTKQTTSFCFGPFSLARANLAIQGVSVTSYALHIDFHSFVIHTGILVYDRNVKD